MRWLVAVREEMAACSDKVANLTSPDLTTKPLHLVMPLQKTTAAQISLVSENQTRNGTRITHYIHTQLVKE